MRYHPESINNAQNNAFCNNIQKMIYSNIQRRNKATSPHTHTKKREKKKREKKKRVHLLVRHNEFSVEVLKISQSIIINFTISYLLLFFKFLEWEV